MSTTTTTTLQCVRSADTGCVVYIDSSAIPAGVKHGRANCRCVKIHGPEDLESIQTSIRVFLAAGGGPHGAFGAKPSVEVAHMLLGMTPVGGAAAARRNAAAHSENKWKMEGGKTWWSMIFAGK
ncbi:hypothetical protein PG993_004775 [Apiospora rasikravindrae]|uniref:Uncharacterized protein n=1 Tax=Apiospora rasikravindrae TaxID=990691 RepID=A0ABR1TFK7_9PEZI